MEKTKIEKILDILESKEQDSKTFSKKHKDRKNEDLHQYYEGANWAFDFAIKTIKDEVGIT